jgi:hypothetical protein
MKAFLFSLQFHLYLTENKNKKQFFVTLFERLKNSPPLVRAHNLRSVGFAFVLLQNVYTGTSIGDAGRSLPKVLIPSLKSKKY